ncbi:ferrochelatase [Pradoshia eiseniae]|uniref:ferrochelatase n=1 Tax=Pradoshia eiseniae TaxID=2064768 RepID=UPI0011B0587B
MSETLEELEKENKQNILNNGGKEYHYLTAASVDPLFIDCLASILSPYLYARQD